MTEPKKIDKRLKKRPPKDTYGRTTKKIDWDLVDELLKAGCLGTEIAPHFDMHVDTFYRRVLQEKFISFSEYQALKRSHGDGVLRRTQYIKALKEDNAMLIWLGKQRLGQKETHDISFDKSLEKGLFTTLNWVKELQEKQKEKDAITLSVEE